MVEDIHCHRTQGFLATTATGLHEYQIGSGWSQVPGVSEPLRGIAGQAGDWAAVGPAGLVLTSVSGKNVNHRNNSSAAVVCGLAWDVAVGDGGVLLRNTSGTWVEDQSFRQAFPAAMPRAVARDGSTIWVVGAEGFAASNQGGWAVATTQAETTNLHAVSTAQGHVYVGGDAGMILHHDGKDWVPETSGCAGAILGVWAHDKAEAYAAGVCGLRRRDPTTGQWNGMIIGSTLQTVWVSPAGMVYSGSLAGGVFRGTNLMPLPAVGPTRSTAATTTMSGLPVSASWTCCSTS